VGCFKYRLFVGVSVNVIARTVRDITMKFLWEQDTVKSTDEFKNDCILV